MSALWGVACPGHNHGITCSSSLIERWGKSWEGGAGERVERCDWLAASLRCFFLPLSPPSFLVFIFFFLLFSDGLAQRGAGPVCLSEEPKEKKLRGIIYGFDMI